MAPKRLKAGIGVAMVGMGLVQASLFAVQSAWIPTGLGVCYSLLGIAFLWVEVYADE